MHVIFVKTEVAYLFFVSSMYIQESSPFLDDYDSMDKCFDMYLKTGKAVTPHRGRGQRISVKNSKYNSESDKENSEDESSSHIAKKVCL